MRPKAILADAVPTGRRQLKETLIDAGFDVLEARTFDEAGQLIRRNADLVVCDPNVANDNCEDLMAMWNARPQRVDVPLVVASEQRYLKTRLAALRGGAANFVVKPAHPIMLLRSLPFRSTSVAATPSRLLVVDDSTTYGHALASALSLDGHDVVLAATAQEARDYLTLERPDAILLDVFLPDGDGIDLARALRSADATGKVPIMMLTGRENTTVRQRANEVGVSGFASKNMPLNEIRGLVGGLVQPGSRAFVQKPQARAQSSMNGQELFSRAVTASGLSEVVARSTLELALRRAGIEIGTLTQESLRSALPQIEQSLATFLPPSEIRQRVLAITMLTKESRQVE